MVNNNSIDTVEYETYSPTGRRAKKVGSLLLATVPLLLPIVSNAADDSRPNIVLLVADDAGYSDFAGFGGEAKTPAMDSLASVGATMTNFHAMPNCSPSRSTFMTGIDNHINGMGTMGHLLPPNNVQTGGSPGYYGYVNDQSVMISTLLKGSGYHTYMVGKWHLGKEDHVEQQPLFPRGTWPIDHGFEQSFGILNGGAEHNGSCERPEGACSRFFENDQILTPEIDFSPTYFSAVAHTDKAIEFIGKGLKEDVERKPFFLYFADTLPHEPNQVPAEYIKQENIEMYYQKGWDGIRADRLQRMKGLGIIPDTLELPARGESFPAWDDDNDPKWEKLFSRVTEPPYNIMWGNIQTVDDLKRTLAKKMAVYTAMVEMFDDQVGNLVSHLKETGEYENTVFFYFSDNGGDSNEWDWIHRNTLMHRGVNNAYENIGNRGSFVSNGREWAQAVNVPFYGAKATNAEGGLRSAMVVAYPGGDIKQASKTDAMTTVADLAATVLDYANVAHPVGTGVKPDWDNCTGTYGEATDICPMNGKSMRTILTGSEASIHEGEPLGFEIFGRVARDQDGKIIGDKPNKALYYEEDGQLWKILRLGDVRFGLGHNEPWRLYNLSTDMSESNDLSAEMPERLAKMMEMYNEYEQNVGVIPQSAQKEVEVAAGSSVLHQFKVSNTGDSTETYQMACRSDWPCVLSSTDEFSLAPGESMNASAVLSVPSSASGITRTTQVSIARTNQPQMSTNQILVTRVAESASELADYQRVMNWGEANVAPNLLAMNGKQIMQFDGYKIRFYPQTQTYLGYKPSDASMYIYNRELYGNTITLLDPLSVYLPQATRDGF